MSVSKRVNTFMTALAATGVMLLGACTETPKLSVKDAYLARRLAFVDQSKPCFMDPFAASPIKVLHHRILLPVMINGVQTIGVLDTGTAVSFITPELAQAAGVRMQSSQDYMTGAAGSFATQRAVVQTLQVGTSVSKNPRIAHVLPFFGSNGTKLGAQVGLDWLEGLDYDLDLPHETMRPYRTVNCAVVDPPWRTAYSGVVLDRGFDGRNTIIRTRSGFVFDDHISVVISFPHADIHAMLDTGAARSSLSHDAALDAGATSSEISADPLLEVYAIDQRKRKFAIHTFADLAIGEDELKDFPIMVARSFDRRDHQMILGMDYVEKRHLWLSFTTNALYIDSGEPRKPTPPLDHAHWVAGSQLPAYPADAKGEKGTVLARCMVEADGRLTGCEVTNGGGHGTLGQAALKWLTGDYGPIMQPAYRNGVAVRESHDWTVDFTN